MEAPGSPYASSPESAPKRAPRSPPQQQPPSEEGDDKEKPIHLRFLVSNASAGCIIGKGGSTINDFQSQSGARIQLSRSHEFFPGTNDRIIMVSGLFGEVGMLAC
uniref:K Homology domain-containing protein n=1 Tax=Zea mays TaxID=4577 RepID=B6T0H2_MAIZE|nr:hypothetical protein [Zea mays]